MIDGLTRTILEERDNIENQRNRELNSNRETYIKQLEQENSQLKDRINKAVEYIEKNKYIIAKYTTANSDSKVIYELYCEPDELLEILKGDKDGGEINEKIINE